MVEYHGRLSWLRASLGVLLSRAGCRLAPVLCVRVSARSNSAPPTKWDWFGEFIASCFHEERLGPANEVDARTADPSQFQEVLRLAAG